MDKDLEEAKKYLKHEIEVYENNKEINRIIGGKAGEIQHEVYKTVLQALEELQQKEKSRIIGNINEIKIEDLEPILKPHYISKEKVKKKIEELEKQRDKADKEDKIGTGIVLTGGIRYLEELLGE